MKTYEWLLFDVDDTLFHFDAYKGLQLMFSRFNKPFTLEDYQAYQAINQPAWVNYQNGEINIQQLRHKCFSHWLDKLSISMDEFTKAFMSAMTDTCEPVAGVVNLLGSLKGNYNLGIITNGFAELLHSRMERVGIKEYFDFFVISEHIGIAKPHRDIFEHALTLMGNPAREKVLMIGDNPDSDILGGMNVGINTCWLNMHNKPIPHTITPHHQVASIQELEELLIKQPTFSISY